MIYCWCNGLPHWAYGFTALCAFNIGEWVGAQREIEQHKSQKIEPKGT